MLTRRTDLGGSSTVVSLGAEVAALFPSIDEHVGTPVWPDGKPRRTSTLTIFCEDGLVKLCLSDRAQQLVAFVTGKSLSEAAEVLELQLAGGTAEWRKAEGGRAAAKK